MRLAIGKRSEALVVFLACCVPECQLDRLAVHPTVCYVVLEHGRNIALDGVSSALLAKVDYERLLLESSPA